jgi:hypothetical protein
VVHEPEPRDQVEARSALPLDGGERFRARQIGLDEPRPGGRPARRQPQELAARVDADVVERAAEPAIEEGAEAPVAATDV